ncbi:hypothetical protein MKZ38_000875 [Zalerion maritima]|uniref:rRNA processing protein EBP2 n=1 Tax=Zalerion maritima TaxID=339359 RepID=A0AAD5RZ02_9PEZI|nr:hypothetical protein MKZ38_000875 [Zalerion maritima]
MTSAATMVNKGKLKMALAAEQGTSWKKITEKRRSKAARKDKDAKAPSARTPKRKADEGDDDNWEGVDSDEDDDEQNGAPLSGQSSDEEEIGGVDLDMINESDSDSEVEMEERIPKKARTSKPLAKPRKDAEPEEDEDEEDEEDILLSDLEDIPESDREDLIPHQRSTINNTSALISILNRIRMPTDDSVSFASHMTVVASKPTAAGIDDIHDDVKRELAFYSQAKTAAIEGRRRLRKEGATFTRPGDYFAEMVKDDGHMEKVKAKLVEEATNKKAAAEARKLRDLKKFGKQVQVAKLQERAKQKRETLDKIKTLKKKRSDTSGAGLGTNEADLFDVGVDTELSKSSASKKRGPPGGGRDGGNPHKRQKKNEKYGFGGKKRHSKSGDAKSSGDLSGFSVRKMKGMPSSGGGAKQRPGKARRKAMR